MRRQQLSQRLDRSLEVPGRLLHADGFEGIDLVAAGERKADQQPRDERAAARDAGRSRTADGTHRANIDDDGEPQTGSLR